MATIEQYEKLTVRERMQRYFSEEIKKKKVSELDRNLTSISEICREYQVSRTSVSRWVNKYSRMRQKKQKQVVEAKSDTRKIGQLKDEVHELEHIVGQKQLKIDFLEKMIEIAEQEYGVDIKKKFSSKLSIGTGTIVKNTTKK
jgi:transposase